MQLKIRAEKRSDHTAVHNLIAQAFEQEEISDHREQFLVARLRASPHFIPELSLVAEIDHKIKGHILLSKIKIKNEHQFFEALALAPLAILPSYQCKGIGTALVAKAHTIAADLGHQRVVVLGHSTYYLRFGYQPIDLFDIQMPFEAPSENCLIIGLEESALTGVSGVVQYPPEFFE
jgi:predicted N-acetyltransferase YhbS